MAFSSQFSMSLELTRLLPLGSTVNFLGGAISKLARELTASGSDIVIEEDLAAIFGRLRICQHLEKTFRVVIGSTERTAISKLLDIVLESGPGPTVQRALTASGEEYRYLSTVIQLSLLSYVHEPSGLADGLSYVLQKRLDGAPEGHPPAPGYDALFGIIRACREQTNRFQWECVFERVHQDLGQVYETAYETAYPIVSKHPFMLQGSCRSLSYPILQGLLDMFLAIQSLPEDRTIYIETLKGVPTIVAWAHHVLGFTVQVNLFNADNTEESISFGDGQPQIVVDARHNTDTRGSEICLLNTNDSEILFHLTQVGDETKIPLEASRRRPLRGFAANLIISLAGKQRVSLDAQVKDRLIRWIISDVVCYGIGTFLAKSGWKPPKPDYGESLKHFQDMLRDSPYKSWSSVEQTISIMFEVPVSGIENEVFSLLHNGTKSYQSMKREETYLISNSKPLKVNIEPLVVLVRVFSCVDGIDECADLQVPDSFGYELPQGLSTTFMRRPKNGPRWKTLTYRDRNNARNWDEATLLEFFALILFGTSFRQQEGNVSLSFKKTSLISEYGWTAFLPTVDVMDPCEISLYQIHLKRGVPVRNDVRRRRIEDGGVVTTASKISGRFYALPNGETQEHKVAESVHPAADIDSIDMDRSRAFFANPKVGVTNSAFVVTFTIQGQAWGLAETGIRRMYRIATSASLWKLDGCDHHAEKNYEVLAAPRAVSEVHLMEGVDPILNNTIPNRRRYEALRTNGYFLLLTSGNTAGRWLSLCFGQSHAKVCLRHPRACIKCVLDCIDVFEYPKSSDYLPFKQRVIIL